MFQAVCKATCKWSVKPGLLPVWKPLMSAMQLKPSTQALLDPSDQPWEVEAGCADWCSSDDHH
jgi:hypothetical protein